MYFVVIETKIIIKKNFWYISSHVVFQNSNIVKSRIYLGFYNITILKNYMRRYVLKVMKISFFLFFIRPVDSFGSGLIYGEKPFMVGVYSGGPISGWA